MMWYDETGNDRDVILSSRVRFARNLKDYPFDGHMSEKDSKDVISKVRSVFKDDSNYNYLDFATCPVTRKKELAEKHLVSYELADKKSECGLIENEKENIYIMLLEEDHMRIQSVVAGYDLKKAYENVCRADDMIENKLDMAFSEKLGYLTRCPTNVGTGMRASVMMFLPAMTYYRQIGRLQNELSQVGLTIRGMFGEGTAASGCLYQVSNDKTLGLTEENILKKLSNVISQICTRERNLRNSLKKNAGSGLENQIMRSYGVMRYATAIDTKELFNLYSDVRLGASLGIIKDICPEKLDKMLIENMPSAVSACIPEGKNDPAERDRIRAERVHKVLSEAD